MDGPHTMLPDSPHTLLTDTPIITVAPLVTLTGVGVPKVKSGVQAALTGKARTGVTTARIETDANKMTRPNPLIEVPSDNPWFPNENRTMISVTTGIVA
jgi:hypothetical protein